MSEDWSPAEAQYLEHHFALLQAGDTKPRITICVRFPPRLGPRLLTAFATKRAPVLRTVLMDIIESHLHDRLHPFLRLDPRAA